MTDGNKQDRIAVIGVSADPEKYGHKIFRDMLAAGYSVVGVNPRGGSILDRGVYRNLDEIEPRPDLVITVVPPAVTEKIVDDCGRLGIKNLWFQPGSGSDTAERKARGYGIRTVSACFMVRKGIW